MGSQGCSARDHKLQAGHVRLLLASRPHSGKRALLIRQLRHYGPDPCTEMGQEQHSTVRRRPRQRDDIRTERRRTQRQDAGRLSPREGALPQGGDNERQRSRSRERDPGSYPRGTVRELQEDNGLGRPDRPRQDAFRLHSRDIRNHRHLQQGARTAPGGHLRACYRRLCMHHQH